MTSAHWHLTYPDDLVPEPVLWELAQRFGLVTNIRRANIEDTVAWAIVEVRGDPETLDAARGWLAERGVVVADIES